MALSAMNRDAYREPWDDTIDLRELLQVILKRKWLIVGITVAAATVAAFLSFFVLPPVYESEVVLQLPDVQSLAGAEFTLDAFAAMARSPSVLGKVVAQVPGVKSAQNLRNDYNVKLEPQGRLLTARAQAGTSDEANRLVAEWTEIFTAAVTTSLMQTSKERLALAEGSLLTRRAALEQARTALESFDSANALDVLEAQLRSLESEVLASEQRLHNVKLHTIPDNEERLAYLQSELEKHPRTLDVEGVPGLVVETSQAQSGMVVTTSSLINPTYLHIQQSIVEVSERLATDRALLERLTTFLEEVPEQLTATREGLSNLRLQREALLADVTTAQTLYQNAEAEYSAWSDRVAMSEGATPRVVSEPSRPTSPVKPRKMLNTALAAFLGMFVALGVTFLMEIWPNETSQGKEAAVS